MPINKAERSVSFHTELGDVAVAYDPRRFIKVTIGYRSIFLPCETAGPIIEAFAQARGAETFYVEGSEVSVYNASPELKLEFVDGAHFIDTEESRRYTEKKKVAEAAEKAFAEEPNKG